MRTQKTYRWQIISIFSLLALLALACSFAPLSGGEQAAPEAVAVIEEAPDNPAGAPDLQPIHVKALTIEIGICNSQSCQSPIPVEAATQRVAVVSGDWPELCAQLAQINQQVSGNQFTIELLASAPQPDCPPDFVGLSFRLAIPLNMVEMEPGSYRVVVNDFETSFEWAPGKAGSPGAPEGAAYTLAYLGPDGNLWAMEVNGVEAVTARQITTDGTPPYTDGASVTYFGPRLSSDGTLLAVRRDAGTPVESGMQFETGLWVANLTSGELTQVIEGTPAGFDWKPGTHLLAYGDGVDEAYFTTRGQHDPNLANGIQGYDYDSGETVTLVEPERGYALYGPQWSPDGRFLAFTEVAYYEGSGLVAFYDFEAQEYFAWDEPLGNVDWSPDSAQLAYDRLTYAPNGEERIFLNSRTGGAERQVSSDYADAGYSFLPVFSPDGSQLAYFDSLGGPEGQFYTLMVQDLSGQAEARPLGEFEGVWDMAWSPDGSQLIFSAGPWDQQQIYAVDAADSSLTVLTAGSQPALPGN